LAEHVRIEARPKAQSASLGQDQLDTRGSDGTGSDRDLHESRCLRAAGVANGHLAQQTTLPKRSPPGVETRLAQPMTPTEGPDAEIGTLPETDEIEPMTLFGRI